MFVAALDTCALWPSLRRDFLLSMAADGLYRPVWSEATLDELHYCEVRKLVRRGRSDEDADLAADHLIERMRSAFDDALVDDYHLVNWVGLPDPYDEHVVAAAIRAGAQCIVTDNLRDFPPTTMPSGIMIITPGDFARDTVSVNPVRALASVANMAARRTDTPIAHILDSLESRYDMIEAVGLLRWAAAR